ncbi:hypothetical protein ACJIZ3_023698 [Penstemon smallii]|uniref:LysM domain-containing protein n=1 Tax=Penstemon smallii TaxID=265156 RepID=A0ABD3TS42_9LAMI
MSKMSSCSTALLLALMLLLSYFESSEARDLTNEIYVVREGETLHTISNKCGDPFIVEENPYIHDPDDVFSGFGY